MKYRVAIWASAGFLVARGWGIYFATADKTKPIEPLVSALARVTQPIAAVAAAYIHSPISLNSVLLVNAATYALAGLTLEALRRAPSPPAAE